MNTWLKVLALALVATAGFALGHHVTALAGAAELSDKQGAWDTERAELAGQRADAINARMLAEHAKAIALDGAAASYEQGKTDAQAAADQAIADLNAGARRLRDQWATCRATSAVAVSAAAAGAGEPDDQAQLRAAGVGRVLRIVGQCEAHVTALQKALTADRQQEPSP